ncbi:monovalent cation/H(+) antiporter subunit G [uncultured Mesonia sp.]|uniref:monovalent cation/H(+) antiporter subunit G n=1 Tax=uncultured Mesonia sp. TaxID=399731 RepID=UPI00374EA8C2
MTDALIIGFSTLGAVFIFLAAVGFLRMPDTYLRISVTTKAVTLGVGLILVAAAIYFDDLSVTSRVLAIILFIILTAPVGAHLIGRASYLLEMPLWKKTKKDELKGKYKRITHHLSSEEEYVEPKKEKED